VQPVYKTHITFFNHNYHLMKLLIIIILIFTSNINLKSQDNIIDSTNLDTAKTILLIPFSQYMYYNDAMLEFAKNSNMTYEQMLNFTQTQLDFNLQKAFFEGSTVSLLNNYTYSASEDLDIIYSMIGYFLDECPTKNDTTEKKSFFNKFEKRKTKSSGKEIQDGIFGGEQKNIQKDNSNKFVNIKFEDENFLKDLSKKYDVDLMLFITQFEIKGDFSDPLNVSSDSYNYWIKIHYSIFDFKGKFLYGNISQIPFPSTNKYIKTVYKIYFPKLVENIKQAPPFIK